MNPKLLQVLHDIEDGKINSAHIYELVENVSLEFPKYKF